MATIEEQKKEILPYLQRADEVEKVDPKVAYYCRLHAVDQGLKLPQRAPALEELLVALLGQLEKRKKTLQLDKEADQQHCEAFALKIFNAADRADRAGRADKGTANRFYASSFFFDILTQFAPLSASNAEMQRYAAWKAADIRKALREGRQPTPGPPGAALPDVGLDDLEKELDAVPGALTAPGGAPGGAAAGGAPGGAAAGVAPGVGPGGGPEGTSGAQDDDDSGLPSVPTRRAFGGTAPGQGAPPTDAPPGPAASAPSGHLPPGLPPGGHPSGPPADAPRFTRGQRVLVRQEGHGTAPVRGTVAGLAEEPGQPRAYKVALAQSFASLPEADLAPDLAPGTALDVRLMAGALARGRVTQVHALQWCGAPANTTAPSPRKDPAAQTRQAVRVDVLLVQVSLHVPFARPVLYEFVGDDGEDRTVEAGQLQLPLRAGEGAAAPQGPPQGPAGAFHVSQQEPSQPPPPPPPAGSFLSSSPSAPGPPLPAPAGPPRGPAGPQHSAAQPPHSVQRPPLPSAPPPAAAQPAWGPAASQPQPAGPAGGGMPTSHCDLLCRGAAFAPSLPAVLEAQKLAKYAQSALGFDDVPNAVKNLQDALRLLTQPS